MSTAVGAPTMDTHQPYLSERHLDGTQQKNPFILFCFLFFSILVFKLFFFKPCFYEWNLDPEKNGDEFEQIPAC